MKNITGVLILILIFALQNTMAQGNLGGVSKTPRDGAYEKVHITQNKPTPYPYLSEDDVLWSKRIWRTIDFREKVNQVFYFPEKPQGQWWSLMTILLKGVETGALTAYSSDNFELPLKKDEVLSSLNKTETKRFQRPDNPDIEYDTTIVYEFKPSDVKSLRIKEDWIFDKKRSEMFVRIIGICPVKDNYDENGVWRGEEPMFWIYFPEARNLFAQHEVFNQNNGARRLTYDELFIKRRFNSLVIKEENNYDRNINAYAKGIDALLEAERIKNELLDWENNLWVY